MNEGRPALFLDRDGVINVDHGYVCTPERTEFMPGVFELVRRANQVGRVVVVVTNQAGIARGYYSEADFHAYMRWMGEQFDRAGAHLDAVFFCPHHPSSGLGAYRQVCRCRKPAPGMLLDARDALQLDLSASVLIGDKPSDVAAGIAAGLACSLLLGSKQLPTLDHYHP